MHVHAQIPGPRDEIEGQIVDNGILAEELGTEHIGEDTTIMMQVYKHRLSLWREVRREGRDRHGFWCSEDCVAKHRLGIIGHHNVFHKQKFILGGGGGGRGGVLGHITVSALTHLH
jgi:hypothetical protein